MTEFINSNLIHLFSNHYEYLPAFESESKLLLCFTLLANYDRHK